MHVVDAVEEVVLIVPAKGAEQHAKIQPRVADSLHIFIQHGQQGMWLLVEVVQIPCADGRRRLTEACAIPAANMLHVPHQVCKMFLSHKNEADYHHNMCTILYRQLGGGIPFCVKIIGIINCDLFL